MTLSEAKLDAFFNRDKSLWKWFEAHPEHRTWMERYDARVHWNHQKSRPIIMEWYRDE